jgi:hypothetical protein
MTVCTFVQSEIYSFIRKAFITFLFQGRNKTLVLVGIAIKRLKVPKRENFSLAFFALSEPTCVCDLGSGEKNRIFYQMASDFEGLWFFAAY